MTPTAAVITVSSAVAAGDEPDLAGPLLVAKLEDAGLRVLATEALADEQAAIEDRLRAHVQADVAVIVTAGGTGLTPDDLTPEATAGVIERDAPGLAEALRAESLRHTPMGALTRGRAGIANRTLIVNLPGSPKAIGEVFDAVLAPVLAHAIALVRSPGGSRAIHGS